MHDPDKPFNQYQADAALRRAQAFRMRADGMKVTEISKLLGVTRQRVYQWFGKASEGRNDGGVPQ